MTEVSNSERDEQTPDTEELEEPSTEKEPEEEPKAPETGDAEPSHEAVGIGLVGGPLTDPEPGQDASESTVQSNGEDAAGSR